MMDNKGQLSAEYLLLAGVLIILVMLAIVFVASENELKELDENKMYIIKVEEKEFLLSVTGNKNELTNSTLYQFINTLN